MAPVSLDPPLMCIVYVYAGELLYYLDPKVIKTLTERLNEKLPEILNHDCNEIKTRRGRQLPLTCILLGTFCMQSMILGVANLTTATSFICSSLHCEILADEVVLSSSLSSPALKLTATILPST